MNKRALCMLLAVVLLAAGAVGCRKKQSEAAAAAEAAARMEPTSAMPTMAPTTAPNPGMTGLSVNHVARVKIPAAVKAMFTASGIIYQSAQGGYGVVSIDGKKDTGAKYAYASEIAGGSGKGYIVTTAASKTENINPCGLMNKYGEMLLENKFAHIKMINDRYAQVITALEKTDDEKEALVYYTDRSHALSPEEGDVMYRGRWELYDLKNREFVNRVVGSTSDYITAKGQFVTYTLDSGKKLTVDAAGEAVTDGRQILDDGSYILDKKDGKKTLYSTDGKRLFDYDPSLFLVRGVVDGYYYAKNDLGYFLLNSKGEKLSCEFTSFITHAFPDFVLVSGHVLTYEGRDMFSEKINALEYDIVNRDAYYARGSYYSYLIDPKGNVLLYQPVNKDKFHGNNFEFYQIKEDGNLFFDQRNDTYSIKGTSVSAPWLVSVGEDDGEEASAHDLIDARTNNMLMTDFGRYVTARDRDNRIQYVFALRLVNKKLSYTDFSIYTVSV